MIDSAFLILVVGSFLVAACNAAFSAVAVSVLGTWLGRELVDKMSERVFRLAFRVLVTATAIRLVYVKTV